MVSSGQQLGSYEVVARLGRGGMASLFLGRRSGPADFSRFVALKVVHEELAHDVKLIEMLLDEARMAVHVQHPNVVRVEELGEADGRPYLVMEYVDGVTLSAVLAGLVQRRELLPVATAVHLAAEVAAGLHAAHDATDERGRPLGMVHRDVSPQNVMISAHGHVKVIDFGVAKAKGRLTQTAHGAIKGKLAYMAPEQVGGEPVDRRTDVFALGILLWEMLTRRRLFFSRDSAKTIAWIREAQVIPPREHRPEIPPELETIVMRALSRNPEDRYATAAGMRRALMTSAAFASIEPAELASMVRVAARDQLKQARPTMSPSLMEKTLVSHPDRPLPLSVDALVQAIREGLTNQDEATFGAVDVLLFAFGRPDAVEAVLGAERGRIADGVRARIAAHRGDLSEELRLRESVRGLMREDEQADAQHYAHATLDCASVLVKLGAYARAEQQLRKALGGGLRATPRTAEAWLLLARTRVGQGRFGQAEDDFERAADEAERSGVGEVVLHVAVARAASAFLSGRRVLARAEAERAQDLARLADHTVWRVRAFIEVSRASLATRDTKAAVKAAQEVERLGRRQGLKLDTPEIAPVLALAAELDGRRDDAEVMRRSARAALLERAAKISDPEWRARFLADIPAHAELMRDTHP
ncbi:MAG: protein kinase [Sandaracinaceae bacterium]